MSEFDDLTFITNIKNYIKENCDDLKEVALFVAQKLSTLEGVRSTKTHFLLKTYKENDVLYVEDESDRREGVMA